MLYWYYLGGIFILVYLKYNGIDETMFSWGGCLFVFSAGVILVSFTSSRNFLTLEFPYFIWSYII